MKTGVTATETAQRDPFVAVRVRDPNGHRSVVLEGLKASASVVEIKSRAMAALNLEDDLDWNVRHDTTGRLLQEDQRLAEVADVGTQAEFTMQPDASLGGC
jgi:hypothetical protein